MANNIFKSIAKLQKLSTTLCINKQITKKHLRLILEVNISTSAKYINELMAVTEDLLRVKGYYRTDERIKKCDNALDEWLKQYRVNKEVLSNGDSINRVR